ncbi:MAG: hypothetical protein IKC64_02510 [Clostridia bacterium]|nr:hypothetical protein [Clostridia bacterium]
MKNFFKRFKLSEWLLLVQLLLSVITLFLATFLGDTIVDIIGLAGNIINAIAILVVFSVENSRNIRYYELTGQFIFNRLGESFPSFMDFLMSDEYERVPIDEHNLLEAKLVEFAREGDYDTKRKISRALPYLYEVDKSMTVELIEILREDLYQGRTDIRRRTLEAMVTIIQKEDNPKRKVKIANKFFDFFAYHDRDDSYTITASIENYYFVYEYVYTKESDKQKCLDALAQLKEQVAVAKEAKIGEIDDCLVGDIDNIWKVLGTLSQLKTVDANYAKNNDFIESVLTSGNKYSKLAVVKNLYYTCKNFPSCLNSHTCSAVGSAFMMDKIDDFLTNALDADMYLSMPTVRYFDCVCNNITKSGAKTVARRIMREYFSADELIIPQTAFDKFAKLLATDRAFAIEVCNELLRAVSNSATTQGKEIAVMLDALSEEKRALFSVEVGRPKFKTVGDVTPYLDKKKVEHADVRAVATQIKRYNERIKFIGKIKKFKEDHNL